jgi:chorismate lyase/3-hydroxybenzoate synthase
VIGGKGRGRRTVLVGGTASIRGEESVHVGDLHGQTMETFENLRALVRAAYGRVSEGDVPEEAGLHCFRDLRVYVVRESDVAAVTERVTGAFTSVERVEYVIADLCRPELLVEIEGVA